MAAKLQATRCVSEDEEAAWLIPYWCGKDIRGLIKMPFSRHWLMHIEAMRRIKNRLCKMARKGVDPVAYCGLSCSHCFLGEWCGSCRTVYNTCSFATVSPDGICPNVRCCRDRLAVCAAGLCVLGTGEQLHPVSVQQRSLADRCHQGAMLRDRGCPHRSDHTRESSRGC